MRSRWTLMLLVASAGWGADSGPLRAGAAKVDITPSLDWGLTNAWSTRYDGVHDPVFARAIVVSNGSATAAIVAIDSVGNTESAAMLDRIVKETGIPAASILLVTTHDHNSPRVGARAGETASAGVKAWIAKATDGVVEAVRKAKANLEPARMGLGIGRADLNINRDELTAQGWKLGNNPDGPSDKTVWVLRFDRASGEPIALFVNYAVHSVVMGPENTKITGDISGEASRFVEEHYGNRAVALWTSGPAGDQNPKYMTWDTTFTNKTTEPGFRLNDTLGHMLGEEILRTAKAIHQFAGDVRIRTAETAVTCPGRTPTRGPAGAPAPAGEAPAPVDLHLSLIRLNDIALAGVQSEIVTNIYRRLQRESPLSATIMVTHDRGSNGYIPEDAAYDTPTFEVSGTRFQKGCAEAGIVRGVVEMIGRN